MKKRNLFILLAALIAGPLLTSAQYFQQQVDYSIDVNLTDSTHSLDGFASIHYFNHSPDTLTYIWIRCWPNAFRNDRTALSEQLIRFGRTDFYFSDKTRKGYINRLEFRVDGQLARMEDHPQYIDVIRVFLPSPLPPGGQTTLTTPFHVQLPDNFAHCGYHQGVYEVTHWFPSPAVYDNRGWHPDPYLNESSTYSDFGDFDVRITVPADFVVAASTEPETTSTIPATSETPTTASFFGAGSSGSRPVAKKTLRYRESNSPDFAWFASRRFLAGTDSLQLASGRVIRLHSYYLVKGKGWTASLQLLKNAIRDHSLAYGEYPFGSASIVQTPLDKGYPLTRRSSGRAYPGITAIDARDSSYYALSNSIRQAVGDDWLSMAVGADTRRFPWMAVGISRYYEARRQAGESHFNEYFSPRDAFRHAEVNTQIVLKRDQPVSTSFDELTPANYKLIAGYKTAIWLSDLQQALGTPQFDSSMANYFRRQEFHHAGPADLKSAFTAATGLDLDSSFALLDKREPVPPLPDKQKLKPWPRFLPLPSRANNLNISPAIGYNEYDKMMIGLVVHNFNLPPKNWQVLAIPFYSTVSHQFNGLFHFNYAWYPHRTVRLIETGLNGSRFSTISGTDSNGHAIFGGFYKIVPYLRFSFQQSAGSTRESWLEWKTYLIGESGFSNYLLKSTDSMYYPTRGKYDFRYLNQLGFTIRDNRTLYPYAINLQAQQAAAFYRLNLDIRYLFNYENGGGLNVRLFAAKFGYLGGRDPSLDLTPFEPKLTALRGNEDYTYQDYFLGRNEYNGLASGQILLRDGDLPLRTDLFQGLQGRSDNWVAAVNLTSTLPPAIVPTWLPLKVFFDMGTYAQAWSDNPPTSQFLYVSGFELDLFGNVLRIFAPLVYSSDFRNQLKTVPGQNGFFQRLSFSIDFQQVPFRKWIGYTPF